MKKNNSEPKVRIYTASTLAMCCLISQPTLANNEYTNPDRIGTQLLLIQELTNNLTQRVDSNLDTIIFEKNTDTSFFSRFFFEYDTRGGETPYSSGHSGVLGSDAVFRNMVFKGDPAVGPDNNVFTLYGSQPGSCNPCSQNELEVSTRSLTVDNITLTLDEYPSPDVDPNSTRTDFIEDFIIYGGINLNNGHLLLDKAFGSGSQISFGANTDVLISVSGSNNRITAPGGAISRSFNTTELRLNDNATLTFEGTSELNARDYGFLSMNLGSTLNIEDSKVVLTKQVGVSTPNSLINGGSVSISGLFGSDPSSLVLSNPTFKNSTINIGQNNRLASSRKRSGVFEASDFYFEGDNVINLELGAAITGFTAENDDAITDFVFNDGTSRFTGVLSGAQSSKINAQSITLDNAHLVHKGVVFPNQFEFLTLTNGSSLSHEENNGAELSHLKLFQISDSTLQKDYSLGLNAITQSRFNNATIKQTDNRLTRSNTFYLNGIDGFGPDAKATVSFIGSSVFESRVDPSGKDIGLPINITTGFKSYADAVFFRRQQDFTDEAFSVNGLGNLTVELQAFAPGLTADDYVQGGENSDGVYDVLFFTQGGTATTVATADSNTVAVTLGSDMPTLLTATQVANPSADQQVSYRLEKAAPTAVAATLTSKPNVTTANQTSSANLVANAYQNGNSTVQTALNSLTNGQTSAALDAVHAEPYSSFMTVSLEHADLMLNTLLGQATTSGAFESNISTLNMQTAPLSEASALRNELAMGQTRSGRSWGDASYIKGKVDGEDGLGTYKYSIGSLTFGHDLLTTQHSNVGAYFSLGDQSMDEHDKAEQNFKSTAVHIGAYGSLNLESDWELRGVWGAGFADNETQRTVVVGNVIETPEADFDSYSTYLGASLGKTLYTNDYVALRPEVGANYIYYKQEKIQETQGLGFALNIEAASAQSLVSNLALKARFKELGECQIAPLAFVRYEFDLHASKDSAHDIDAALGGAPGYKQSFSGKNRGKHALSTGLGFDTPLDTNLHMGGGVAYSFNSHGYEWGAGLNMAYYW